MVERVCPAQEEIVLDVECRIYSAQIKGIVKIATYQTHDGCGATRAGQEGGITVDDPDIEKSGVGDVELGGCQVDPTASTTEEAVVDGDQRICGTSVDRIISNVVGHQGGG